MELGESRSGADALPDGAAVAAEALANLGGAAAAAAPATGQWAAEMKACAPLCTALSHA